MEPCKNGKHTLIMIQRSYQECDSAAVVRWCEFCGAVVVDIDFDGRTQSGAVMSMRFPKIAIEAVEEE